jgi:hypothetical protein
MKVAVIAAEHVRRTALGGLHHTKIAGITQRGVVRRAENHHLRDILQELSVVVKLEIRERIELLQSRITEQPCRLNNDLVRDQERMTAFKYGVEHLSSR